MVGILGKKIGMTQIFDENGQAIALTVIESNSCCVLQIKTRQRDGYNALQLGLAEAKASQVSKPLRQRFKQIKVSPKKFIREILVQNPSDYKIGQKIEVSVFSPGDLVNIVACAKGRGFQGGIKRWRWSGGPDSHGSMSHRAPGSIGASAFPSRVHKGHHLPGHLGNSRVTIQNLEVIKVDKDNHLLAVKGSVPGHQNCYLILIKSPRKKSKPIKKEAQSEQKAEAKPKAPAPQGQAAKT